MSSTLLEKLKRSCPAINSVAPLQILQQKEDLESKFVTLYHTA